MAQQINFAGRCAQSRYEAAQDQDCDKNWYLVQHGFLIFAVLSVLKPVEHARYAEHTPAAKKKGSRQGFYFLH
jgi:hypothetical protein